VPRVLLVTQNVWLQHILELAEGLRECQADTKVICLNEYPLAPRFTLLPSPRLVSNIIEFHPDVVFTDVWNFDAWIARFARYPILAYLRGDIWNEFPYYMQWMRRTSSFQRRLFTIWTHFIRERGLDFVHTIMPCCNWVGHLVKRHRPHKKMHVLYHSIDTAPWTLDDVNEEIELRHPAAVSVFSFNVLPKVMGLVRFLDVIRAMPHVNFYVAGSGPHMNYVTSQNIPQNMRFVGRLSHPDGVRLFLKAADIFVHPSGSDATPSAVLEAQMMKKPVVATNTGGIPEIVCERSLLIEDGDTEAWVDRIQSLLDHPEDRERLGERGRSFVQRNFSIQKAASNLCNYIAEITGH